METFVTSTDNAEHYARPDFVVYTNACVLFIFVAVANQSYERNKWFQPSAEMDANRQVSCV